MHTMTVFEALVEQGCANLLTKGWQVRQDGDASLLLVHRDTSLLVAQDRGFEVVMSIRECDGEDWIALSELADFLTSDTVASLPEFCRLEQEAVKKLAALTRFLEEEAGVFLDGSLEVFEVLRHWVEVTRGLDTQLSTQAARGSLAWFPIQRAWRERRYAELIRLLRGLPKPPSDAEEHALAYALARQ